MEAILLLNIKMEMKIMKNKLMKKRITEMLDKENLTTGQIKRQAKQRNYL